MRDLSVCVCDSLSIFLRWDSNTVLLMLIYWFLIYCLCNIYSLFCLIKWFCFYFGLAVVSWGFVRCGDIFVTLCELIVADVTLKRWAVKKNQPKLIWFSPKGSVGICNSCLHVRWMLLICWTVLFALRKLRKCEQLDEIALVWTFIIVCMM